MPTASYSRGLWGHFAALLLLTLSSIAFKEMRLGTAALATQEPITAVVTTLKFENDVRLRTEYTGVTWVDFGMRYLVTAFLPGVAGWDKGFQIQQIYFLLSFFPIISTWSVEAGRRRNIWAWTSFTTIWALFYQTVGGAVIIPLYYLTYLRESRSIEYWQPASRNVPISYAKMLLPALVGGYLVPTLAMYFPWNDADLSFTQGAVALWQVTPLLVNILLFNPSMFQKEPINEAAPPQDVKYLNRVYITSFIVSAVAHIATLFLTFTSTTKEMSFVRAIGLVPVSETMSMTDAFHYIFQVDFWLIFTAALVGSYVTLWDLKRAGKTDLSMFKSLVLIAIGSVLVGPGATVAGVWYVREGIMARKEKV